MLHLVKMPAGCALIGYIVWLCSNESLLRNYGERFVAMTLSEY